MGEMAFNGFNDTLLMLRRKIKSLSQLAKIFYTWPLKGLLRGFQGYFRVYVRKLLAAQSFKNKHLNHTSALYLVAPEVIFAAVVRAGDLFKLASIFFC